MTGYERLLSELGKEFHHNKILTNERFICAIVRILAENPEDRVALDIATKEKEEAEEIKAQARAIKESAEQKMLEVELSKKDLEKQLSLVEMKKSTIKVLMKQAEKIRAEITACETPEARDRMRLANLFRAECSREKDGLAYVRGLSNILGTEGVKEDDNTPVLGYL